jgi:hypothetical protein
MENLCGAERISCVKNIDHHSQLLQNFALISQKGRRNRCAYYL